MKLSILGEVHLTLTTPSSDFMEIHGCSYTDSYIPDDAGHEVPYVW